MSNCRSVLEQQLRATPTLKHHAKIVLLLSFKRNSSAVYITYDVPDAVLLCTLNAHILT